MRLWLCICFLSIGILYVLTIYYDIKLEWEHSKLYFVIGVNHEPPITSNSSTKLILFWNTMFGDETFYYGHGDVFKDCPGVSINCYATPDRTIANIEDFDAIMFHANEVDLSDLPPKRQAKQFYVFTNLESPANRPLIDSKLEDYFNLTMTYRRDSDILWAYDAIIDRDTGNVAWPMHSHIFSKTRADSATDKIPKKYDKESILELIKKKSKSAAWFVSNCNSKSGREKYVDELIRYIDVDIYGGCGDKHCGRDDDCFKTVVEPNYYFYLSFENSFCQDYVTEKFYNAARFNVVPVVYGGANYSLYAPPNSYINTLDFDSPEHLAKYLKMLIANPEEYARYFQWKERYKVGYDNKLSICNLCRMLHDENITSKTYYHLSTWYESNKCPLQEELQISPYITRLSVKKMKVNQY